MPTILKSTKSRLLWSICTIQRQKKKASLSQLRSLRITKPKKINNRLNELRVASLDKLAPPSQQKLRAINSDSYSSNGKKS